MTALTREELLSLERYAEVRDAFRARVIEHKRRRRVALGPQLMLHFEDRLTVQYQIQEMLRIERIFEPKAIQEELDAYNPLIPNGHDWRATLMIEYQDPLERREALARLVGIERALWMTAPGTEPVRGCRLDGTAQEALDRTPAVHFIRFPLAPEQVDAVRSGAALILGCDHPHYRHEAVLEPALVATLCSDLA